MDYRVRPIGGECAGTGLPLTPGAVVRSVLIEMDEDLVRRDFSDDGWAGEPERTLAVWRSVVPTPAAKKAGLDVDEQFARFELLAEEDAPHQAPLTYVLSLWLMRRRRVRLEGTISEDGVDRLVVHGTRGEGPFHIRDQQLSAGQVEELQAALFGVEAVETRAAA